MTVVVSVLHQPLTIARKPANNQLAQEKTEIRGVHEIFQTSGAALYECGINCVYNIVDLLDRLPNLLHLHFVG